MGVCCIQRQPMGFIRLTFFQTKQCVLLPGGGTNARQQCVDGCTAVVAQIEAMEQVILMTRPKLKERLGSLHLRASHDFDLCRSLALIETDFQT
jgi:hypothetical protein